MKNTEMMTLENLKCSVQNHWGCTYLCIKSNVGTWGNYLSF